MNYFAPQSTNTPKRSSWPSSMSGHCPSFFLLCDSEAGLNLVKMTLDLLATLYLLKSWRGVNCSWIYTCPENQNNVGAGVTAATYISTWESQDRGELRGEKKKKQNWKTKRKLALRTVWGSCPAMSESSPTPARCSPHESTHSALAKNNLKWSWCH